MSSLPRSPRSKSSSSSVLQEKNRSDNISKLKSVDDVLQIIKIICQLYNSPDYKHIWIVTDLTQYQRRNLSSLKHEHDHRNASGNATWFIRYIRGSSNLVQKTRFSLNYLPIIQII